MAKKQPDDLVAAALKRTPEQRQQFIALTRRYCKVALLLPREEDYDRAAEKGDADVLHTARFVVAELDRIQAEVGVDFGWQRNPT
jgi:hypothetical protein